MSSLTYNNREKLICNEFPGRSLGIIVTRPFEGKLNNETKMLCEIEGEGISTRTVTFGSTIDYNEWKPQAKQYIKNIIKKIDMIVAELESHKARMENDLTKIDNHGIDKIDKNIINSKFKRK